MVYTAVIEDEYTVFERPWIHLWELNVEMRQIIHTQKDSRRTTCSAMNSKKSNESKAPGMTFTAR